MSTSRFLFAMCAALLLFCVLNNALHAASNERFLRTCKFQADFALMLFKDLQAGVTVNVMPKDQATLNVAKAHKGSAEELWKQVYYACNGQST